MFSPILTTPPPCWGPHGSVGNGISSTLCLILTLGYHKWTLKATLKTSPIASGYQHLQIRQALRRSLNLIIWCRPRVSFPLSFPNSNICRNLCHPFHWAKFHHAKQDRPRNSPDTQRHKLDPNFCSRETPPTIKWGNWASERLISWSNC